MSLYSYLNRESIVTNKLIAFTQAPKFTTLMELLMKSDVITNNDRLRFTSPNGATEITVHDSKITITVDPREQLDPSMVIMGYPYKMMPIAEIELDTTDGTYVLTNIDNRFNGVIDRTIDDLNYIFYQGLD
jgi:hypothetical protein